MEYVSVILMNSYFFQKVHHVAQQPCHRVSCDFAIICRPPCHVYRRTIHMWNKLGYPLSLTTVTDTCIILLYNYELYSLGLR